nr:hypothetical protein [Tanacetum cinerariifolium]
MKEYIRLEEEKAQRHGQMFNWQTATFGKFKYYKDEDDCFIDFETEFSAIAFDNTLTSNMALPSGPTVTPMLYMLSNDMGVFSLTDWHRKLRNIDAIMSNNINKKGGKSHSKIGILKKSGVKTDLPNRHLINSVVRTRQLWTDILRNMKHSTKNVESFPTHNTEETALKLEEIFNNGYCNVRRGKGNSENLIGYLYP